MGAARATDHGSGCEGGEGLAAGHRGWGKCLNLSGTGPSGGDGMGVSGAAAGKTFPLSELSILHGRNEKLYTSQENASTAACVERYIPGCCFIDAAPIRLERPLGGVIPANAFFIPK